MDRDINIAVLGAGSISRGIAATVPHVEGLRLYAVASRDYARACSYRDEFGFEKAYGSYDDMLADANVDLVYIAVPHALHREAALQCLRAGKHILVEKPFTLNAGEAREVLGEAEARGLFAGEAMWTRFLPMTDTVKKIIDSGGIGYVTSISAAIGFPSLSVPRIADRRLGGGALMDLGVYPLSLAMSVFGTDVRKVTASGIVNENGIDVQNAVIIEFAGGNIATLFSTVLAKADTDGFIYGDGGYIRIKDIINPLSVTVHDGWFRAIEVKERFDRPAQVTGYEYELAAAVAAIRRGETEYSRLTHHETLRMLEVTDEVRRQLGVVYDCDML